MRDDKHGAFQLYRSYHVYQRRHMPIHLTASSARDRQQLNKEAELLAAESQHPSTSRHFGDGALFSRLRQPDKRATAQHRTPRLRAPRFSDPGRSRRTREDFPKSERVFTTWSHFKLRLRAFQGTRLKDTSIKEIH